jgi:hypothetical protein
VTISFLARLPRFIFVCAPSALHFCLRAFRALVGKVEILPCAFINALRTSDD